jgi:hypothetical protein
MLWLLWRRTFAIYYRDVQRHPEKLARVSEAEPLADRQLFVQPAVREMYVALFSEAFLQGTDGAARDGWLLARPWGFDLSQMTVPVHLSVARGSRRGYYAGHRVAHGERDPQCQCRQTKPIILEGAFFQHPPPMNENQEG